MIHLTIKLSKYIKSSKNPGSSVEIRHKTGSVGDLQGYLSGWLFSLVFRKGNGAVEMITGMICDAT